VGADRTILRGGLMLGVKTINFEETFGKKERIW